MKKENNLSDLSDFLYDQLYKLSDDSLTDEQQSLQIKKAEAVRNLADTIIKNGELQFKALKMAADVGIVNNKQVRFLLAPPTEKENIKKIGAEEKDDEGI